MNQPKVSIVILNWNGMIDTIECIESLKKIDYKNYEIVIVDNASTGDDIKVLTEKYGDSIHLIANKQNLGFPEGCNVGMRYAFNNNAMYSLLLNNDVIVDSKFLSSLVEVAESDKKIGIIGSKIYYYYQPDKIQAAGGKIIWWLGFLMTYGEEIDKGQYDKIAERDYLYGTSMMIKKDVVEKISYMDPFYFFGVEEYDYCTRAKKAGFKIIYVPESKVWHKVGASSSKVGEYAETKIKIRKTGGFGMYRYFWRLFKTHCPPILFIFPFIGAAVFRMHWLSNALKDIRQGQGRDMIKATLKRIKLIFG